MKKHPKLYSLLLVLVLAAVLFLHVDLGDIGLNEPAGAGQSQPVTQAEPIGNAEADAPSEAGTADAQTALDEDGSYTTAEDVSRYLLTYGHLPANFITKNEARALGWESGSLEPYAPGTCIGGDRFGNREGLLPKASGRVWTECDINTLGARSRGAERIVFSNDGLIYYTGDHYESFTLLAGNP